MALALLLCGCTSQTPPAGGIPVDENGDPLPTLHGVVVDEAIHPLAGATVRFLGTNLSATTDAAGKYEFHRPTLKAEAMLVTAFKQGYLPRTQQVQVSGRHSVRMNFGLQADRYDVPHVDVLKFKGDLGCQLRGEGMPGPASCDPPKLEANPPPDQLPPGVWDLFPVPNFAGVVVQVKWEAESPLAETLHASLRAPMAGGHGGELQAEATGPSPLRLEIPADVARAFPLWNAVRLTVQVPEGTGFALSKEQTFDAFATMFYVDAAPPGYVLG